MYLTDKKMIELTQRSIDKQEQAFESLRNRMYWMLTITTIAMTPLISIEDFSKISVGWKTTIGLIGLIFLMVICIFYFWFVRPREFPIESPIRVYNESSPKNSSFAEKYLGHLVETQMEWERINRLASKRFFKLIIMMLLVVIGVIIFMTIGGSF